MNYWTIVILIILLAGRYLYIENANIAKRITVRPYSTYNPAKAFSYTNVLYKTVILGKTPFIVAKETAYDYSILQMENTKTFVYNTFTYIPFNIADLLKKQTLFNGNFAGPLIKTVSNFWKNLPSMPSPQMFTLESPILEIIKKQSTSYTAMFLVIAVSIFASRLMF